jgi:GDP-D-mannose dehydratase
MKILLLGANGQVGWELQRALQPLGEVLALGHAEADFEQPQALASLVDAQRPQAIVNAAAYTAVDKAESEPERAQRINADAPAVLAEAARRHGAVRAQRYGTFIIEELIEVGEGLTQVSESPDRGLDPQTLSGHEAQSRPPQR